MPRRHLRKLYNDPITGRPDWEIIRAGDGGIIGVNSASTKAPIKRANFAPRDAEFADAAGYCDWKFVFDMTRTHRRGVARKPT